MTKVRAGVTPKVAVKIPAPATTSVRWSSQKGRMVAPPNVAVGRQALVKAVLVTAANWKLPLELALPVLKEPP